MFYIPDQKKKIGGVDRSALVDDRYGGGVLGNAARWKPTESARTVSVKKCGNGDTPGPTSNKVRQKSGQRRPRRQSCLQLAAMPPRQGRPRCTEADTVHDGMITEPPLYSDVAAGHLVFSMTYHSADIMFSALPVPFFVSISVRVGVQNP